MLHSQKLCLKSIHFPNYKIKGLSFPVAHSVNAFIMWAEDFNLRRWKTSVSDHLSLMWFYAMTQTGFLLLFLFLYIHSEWDLYLFQIRAEGHSKLFHFYQRTLFSNAILSPPQVFDLFFSASPKHLFNDSSTSVYITILIYWDNSQASIC